MKILKKILHFISLFLVMFFIAWCIAAAIAPWKEVEIRQSYSTGKCVVMITYSSEFPNGKPEACPAVLPEKYTHVWVE